MQHFSFGRKAMHKSIFEARKNLMLYIIFRLFLEEGGSELLGRGRWPCGLLTFGISMINVLTSNSSYVL